MNKRQAKRIALEVILCLIDMEVFNPSELPYTLLNEYGFDVDDYAKLRDAIEDIAAGLKNKMDTLDSSLGHIREYGTWMFSEKVNRVDVPVKGLIPANCSVIEMLDWALETTLEEIAYAESKIKWDAAQDKETDSDAIEWRERSMKRYQRLFATWERRTNEML